MRESDVARKGRTAVASTIVQRARFMSIFCAFASPSHRRSALVLAALLAAAGAPRAAEGWQLAGQQGIMRYVIVPTELARDREAYARQIEQLCAAGQSCFLNFYTNSSGAPVGLPLPDAIDHEATAVFRRSVKQGGEMLRWSCRLQINPDDCF